MTLLSKEDSLERAQNRRKQKEETGQRMQHVVLKIKSLENDDLPMNPLPDRIREPNPFAPISDGKDTPCPRGGNSSMFIKA